LTLRTQRHTKPSVLLIALLSILASAWPASAKPQAAPILADNPYGVNVFLNKEVEAWKIDKTLQMIHDANITWIKQEFPWQEIEFKKGYFYDDKWQKSSWEKFDQIVDMADKYGLKIVARVSHPPDWAKATDGAGPLANNSDLADFTNALLDHYAGRIKYVQVWNEPNLADEWVPGKAVDPTGYVQMMQAVYPAVKARHPDSVILSAPMAITLEGPELRGNMDDLDYWNGLYSAGIKGLFDVASANAYGLDQPPDAAPGERTLNFRRVELLRDIMVQNGDADRSIWLNEYAWNASPESLSEAEKSYWRHVTEATQAQWTVEGVQYARDHWPWAGVISIWYFRQVGDVSPDKAEYYFRMVNPDFTTAPIYDSVQSDAMKYPGPVSAGETPTPESAPPTPTEAPELATAAPSEPTATVTPAEEATATPEIAATVTPTMTVGAIGTATTTPTPSATKGTPVSATATPTAGVGSGSSGGTNVLLFVLGGALVVAGLGGLAYLFVRGRSKAGRG
jgi:polysaccharide biosynthesis protein PslG